MSLLSEIISNIKKIDEFSLSVVLNGIVISLGLVVIGYIMTDVELTCKNTLMAISCANGAFKAAQIIFAESFIFGIISDMYIKDKNKEKE